MWRFVMSIHAAIDLSLLKWSPLRVGLTPGGALLSIVICVMILSRLIISLFTLDQYAVVLTPGGGPIAIDYSYLIW